MPRLTRIYTRSGDDGSTGLGTGQRVGKDDPQVEAYGEVDELNASIGAAVACGLAVELTEELVRIQSELLNLGGELSLVRREPADAEPTRLIAARHVVALEAACDRLNADLGSLENFILPGGAAGGAALHVARAICRRTERRVVALSRHASIGGDAVRYLNRLSDLLFIMARYENRACGVGDVLWDTSV